MKVLKIGCIIWGAAVLSTVFTAYGEPATIRAVCFLPMEGDISTQLLKGLREEAEKADNLDFSWYYYTDFADMDFEVYADMAIAMQEDYLISFGGTAAGEYEEAVDRLKEADVKLIVVDHDMEDPMDRMAFVGTDNRESAIQILDYVKNEVEHPVAAVFMTYSHGGILERRQTLEEKADQGEIRLASVSVLPEHAMLAGQEIEQVLEENKEVNTVICLDGTSSIAAAQVMEQYEERHLYVVCFDCEDVVVNALKNQKIDLIMAQDYGQMGRECIGLVTAAPLDTEDVRTEIYTKCIPITRGTIDEAQRE